MTAGSWLRFAGYSLTSATWILVYEALFLWLERTGTQSMQASVEAVAASMVYLFIGWLIFLPKAQVQIVRREVRIMVPTPAPLTQPMVPTLITETSKGYTSE